jgi:anti-anti-sigma regulatory factor
MADQAHSMEAAATRIVRYLYQNLHDSAHQPACAYVPEAPGCTYIPAQQTFVIPERIRSVLGFGGMLPDGNLFAIIMFARAPISRMVAERFRPLALNIKISLLPFERQSTFVLLVLPLVGHIDARRSTQITAALLEGIHLYQADRVIIDVTGVPLIDTGVANHLLQTTRAAQLSGAEYIWVGIGAELAQTIVQLGVDLTRLLIRANLRSGVAYATKRRSRSVGDPA